MSWVAAGVAGASLLSSMLSSGKEEGGGGNDYRQPLLPLDGAANPQTGGGFNSLRGGSGSTTIETIGDEGGGMGEMIGKLAPFLEEGLGGIGEDSKALHLPQHPILQAPLATVQQPRGGGTTLTSF